MSIKIYYYPEDNFLLNLNQPGVFTTLLLKKNTPQFFENHIIRLDQQAREFNYLIPNYEKIKNIIKNLSPKSYFSRLRLISTKKNIIITINNYTPPEINSYFNIKTCLYKSNICKYLKHIKHTKNLIIYQQALKFAQRNNFFEALLYDHQNYIFDGSRTSILIFNGENFIAPTGGIASIMRAQVIKYLESCNFNIIHKKITKNNFAQQVFLCNSLMGILSSRPHVFHNTKNLITKFWPYGEK